MPTDPFSKFFKGGLINTSGFDGTIESDFLKLGAIPNNQRENLIDYSLAGFNDYKNALQDYLKAVYPLDYNNFAASDLGQMLLELFAYMGSVVTLKTDMTANEMYLDTVKSPNNLRRLMQLIGVSMKGPTSSKATGKITLSTAATSTITINEGDRLFSVQNNRDSGTITFTLYKQANDGSLDLSEGDLTLALSDSDGSAGLIYDNLFLLEGVRRTQTGTFSPVSDTQKIRITEPSIIEGSLSVSSAEGVVYNEISNLFLASGAGENVFEKTYLSDYGVVLTFGDGLRGSRPAPNTPYIVSYRSGGGTRGNVAKGLVSRGITAFQGVTQLNGTVENTTKASGGNEAESVEHAKKYAPHIFRTQYRAVTGEDYTALSNNFIGTAGLTAKALAAVRKNGAAANVIDIYVLSKASNLQLERASVAFKKEMLDYFAKYKMLTDEVVINDGVVRTLDIVGTVFVDSSKKAFVETIKQKVANKLTNYFNVDNREFGQTLSIADVTSSILTLPEVRFFKLDNIDSDIYINFNEIIQLNNFELNVEFV